MRTAGGKRAGRLSGWHPVDLVSVLKTCLFFHIDVLLVSTLLSLMNLIIYFNLCYGVGCCCPKLPCGQSRNGPCPRRRRIYGNVLLYAVDVLAPTFIINNILSYCCSQGCVSQAGEQAANIARNCVLASNLPESVPGTSLDR